MFQQTLLEMINPTHPLVKLADVIDWEQIERTFGAYFVARTSRPALRPRLVAKLLYLQHAYDCSDEAIVNKGYLGVEIPDVRILRSGQRRGITRALKKMFKLRSAINPTIGHIKMDG